MKRIIYVNLIIVAVLVFNSAHGQFCGVSGSAVCTPASQLTTPGFENPDSIPCAIQGVAYNQSIQLLMFSSFPYLGNNYAVDSIEFDLTHGGIGNLPCGLCWATNNVNNRFKANEYGCLNITGTTNNDTGQYQLQLNLTVWLHNSEPSSLDVPYTLVQEAGINLWLRVQSPSGSCTPVDTSSSAHNDTATATCTVGINEINNDFLSLIIVPNPVNDAAAVKFISTQEGSFALKITDLSGRVLSTKTIQVKAGENTSAIQSNNLPAGIYFLSLANGQSVITKRFTVIN